MMRPLRTLFLPMLIACAAVLCPAADPAQDALVVLDKMESLRTRVVVQVRAGMIRTADDGLLEFTTTTPSPALTQLREEVNQLRLRYFKLMKEDSGQDEATVRKDFAKIEQKDEKFKEVEQDVMIIHGCATLAQDLMKKLLVEFLQSRGYETRPPEADEQGYAVRGRRIAQGGWDVIRVRIMSNGDALKSLYENKCDIALTSREPTNDEKRLFKESKPQLADLNLASFVGVIGLDGIAVLVNADAKTKSISVTELGGLISGTDPAGRKLVRSGAGGAEADDVDFLAKFLDRGNGRTLPSKNASLLKPTDDEVLKALTAAPEKQNLLGLLPWSRVKGTDLKGVRILTVNGLDALQEVEPSSISIRCENYPLVRPLLMSYTIRRSSLAKKFKDFVTTTGQQLVREAGFVDQSMVSEGERGAWTAEAEKTTKYYIRNEFAAYRSLIENSDRASTPFVLHFQFKKKEVELYSGLNPNALPNMRRLITELALRGWQDKEVVLIGHTDASGKDAINNKLGNERVVSLKHELESLGVPVARVGETALPDGTYPNSMGSRMPVGPNQTEEGQAQNRRVELWMRVKK